MNDDTELLRRYVNDRSEDAFRELVRRHIGLVYSCSLRRVGNDTHLAEDVTQKVFCDFARKAQSLRHHRALSGWLYVSAQLAAAEAVRNERRRKAREQRASAMETILNSSGQAPDADWGRLRPLLDDVILELGKTDREAILLRYFQKRPFAEIAGTLGLTEDTARKRVDRAVERLRVRLAKRGVTSTSAALTFAMAEQASAAVPAALAASVAGVALAELAAAGAGASFLASLLGMLTSDATVVGATILAGAGLICWQHASNSALRLELADRTAQTSAINNLRKDNNRLAGRIADAETLRIQLEAIPEATPVSPVPIIEAMAPVNVAVTDKGTIRWEGQNVTLGEFLRRLQSLRIQNPAQEPQLVIRGEPGSAFAAGSYVVEQASKAGIQNISIFGQAPPDPGNNWITPAAIPAAHGERRPPMIPDPGVHP